jgi:CheY-like chemotaxis protein
MSVATVSPSRSLDSSADCRVLVVEDDVICQDIVLLMLERLGFYADVVDDGVGAVSALNGAFYDVVLMDVRMPRMDGMEAAHLIRTESGRTDQPVIIAMTADMTPGCRQECLRAGMDGHLGKPIGIGDLAAVLEHWFQQQGKLELVRPGAPGSRPAAGDSATVVYDAGVFDSLLVDLGGDAAMRTDLIESFILDGRQRLRAIVTAGDASDLGALVFQAHALNSPSAMIGLLALSEMTRQIEAAAKAAPDEVDVFRQAFLLAAECDRAIEALNAEAASTPGPWVRTT